MDNLSLLRPIIGVVGPTGSGKTQLGVQLAEKFNGVIICADSRQVYRQLNAGTNKEGQLGQWHNLPARFINTTPQLLTDVVDLEANFNVAQWLTMARAALELIWQQRHLPILVGGTGLYITSLLSGWVVPTHQPKSSKSLLLLPEMDRQDLYKRADQRIERIFDSVVEEISALRQQGTSAERIEKLGLDYRYPSLYLDKRLSREEAICQYQFAHHAYIRRQLTWWRHHEPVTSVRTPHEAIDRVQIFLQ